MARERTTGTCADCGAAIWFTATRCRKCAARHRRPSRPSRRSRRSISIPTCRDCGAVVARDGFRCQTCANAARRRTNVCQDCGGPVSSGAVLRCRPCYDQRPALHEVCPDCGGWKGWGSVRCQRCDTLRRQSGMVDWRQVVMPFEPAAFRAELARADLEWSADQLSAASGVSGSTIRHWLAGVHKPLRPELEAVVAVLAFERCPSCTGLGYVDPGHPGRQALLNRIAKQRLAPRPLQPASTTHSSVGDGWTLDRNTLWLTVADSRVRLTRQESRVIAVLADAGGHFVTASQIADVISISADAVRTYLNRLRDKFAAAGADLGAVVEHSFGAGYRARMAAQKEVAS